MKNLKTLRRARGYTQAQIAQFVRVGSSTVCRWELGTTKPDLYQILTLCNIFQCTPAQLFDDICRHTLPVFDTDGNLVCCEDISEELSARDCCFGLVIPYDISARISCGDMGFFAFENTAAENMAVIAFDTERNGYVDLCGRLTPNAQIAAVCRFLRAKI